MLLDLPPASFGLVFRLAAKKVVDALHHRGYRSLKRLDRLQFLGPAEIGPACTEGVIGHQANFEPQVAIGADLA